jgi:hypothetical protein
MYVSCRKDSEERQRRPHPLPGLHWSLLDIVYSYFPYHMMMLSRTTTQFAALARRAVAPRAFTTVAEAVHTAEDALKFSGYSSIDFTIAEDLMVYDAVQKFAAFNIGCLVTTDKAGEYSDGDE